MLHSCPHLSYCCFSFPVSLVPAICHLSCLSCLRFCGAFLSFFILTFSSSLDLFQFFMPACPSCRLYRNWTSPPWWRWRWRLYARPIFFFFAISWLDLAVAMCFARNYTKPVLSTLFWLNSTTLITSSLTRYSTWSFRSPPSNISGSDSSYNRSTAFLNLGLSTPLLHHLSRRAVSSLCSWVVPFSFSLFWRPVGTAVVWRFGAPADIAPLRHNFDSCVFSLQVAPPVCFSLLFLPAFT